MNHPRCHFLLETPLGPLAAQADALGRIQHLQFLSRGSLTLDSLAELRHQPTFPFLQRQLDAYFRGTCRTFNMPLAPHGSPLQLDVWCGLVDIPYGETLPCGDFARRLGLGNRIGDVADAVAQNPIHLLFPCHRVLLEAPEDSRLLDLRALEQRGLDAAFIPREAALAATV